MHKWRYIVEDAVGAAHGLGADELLLERAARGEACLRLYTYRSHCALVGLFQCLPAEVDLDTCARLGIEVSRRPTGGGAIIMGAGQLGVAAAVPNEGGGTWDKSFVARCHNAILAGLAGLGLDAEFRPRNDIVVAGKKICGTGALAHEDGAILYHASVLLDLDLALMCEVLRSGVGKRPEQASVELSRRLTTVRREVSSAVEMVQLRQSIAAGFADEFRIALKPDEFNKEDLDEIGRVSRAKYANPEWIDSVAPAREADSSGSLQTPGGILNVHVSLSGATIKSVMFDGDFFGERAVLNAVEAALKWTPADEAAVTGAINGALRRSPGTLSIPPESLARGVMEAVAMTRHPSDKTSPHTHRS